MVQSIVKGDIVRVIEDHGLLRLGDIYEVVAVIPDGILAYSRAHDEYEGIPDGIYEVVLKRPGHQLPRMTLRDWFAGQALASLCNAYNDEKHASDNAKIAYANADAMIARREVPND